MLQLQGLYLKRLYGYLLCKMGLYFIIDKVTCRENEKCVMLTLFSTGATLVYDDISHHRLVFLLGDPNRHPSSGPGPQFAPDVDLCRATRSVTVGRSASL